METKCLRGGCWCFCLGFNRK